MEWWEMMGVVMSLMMMESELIVVGLALLLNSCVLKRIIISKLQIIIRLCLSERFIWWQVKNLG